LLENQQIEDEFCELEIKVKIREDEKARGKRISQELLSEAFRWRLS